MTRNSPRFGLLLLLPLLSVFQPTIAYAAAQPAYLREMPTPKRVLAEVHGKNALDTAALQAGTLHQLTQMIAVMAYDRYYAGRLMPDEQKVRNAYAASEDKILTETMAHFDPEETRRLRDNSPRAKWVFLYRRYSNDQGYVLAKFFSPAWRKNFHAALRAELRKDAAGAKARKQIELNGKQAPPTTSQSLQLFLQDVAESDNISTSALLNLVVGIPLGLLALSLARETRRFGLSETDPFALKAGWTTYTVKTITGTVLSPTKAREVETRVSGGGGGGTVHTGIVIQPISTTTIKTVHDQFFIHDPEQNVEQAYKLTNVDIAVREGHEMSAAKVVKAGQTLGYNFMFRNHTTQRVDFLDDVLRWLVRPRLWPVVPWTMLAPLVCADLWARGLWQVSLHNIDDVRMALVKAAIVALAGFFILRFAVTLLRTARLKSQIINRLVPKLDDNAEPARAEPGV